MSRIRCYVARKDCGCIVAAFPVKMDQACKAEILKQLTKAGFDIDQTSDWEVHERFNLACDCNKPPLLKIADNGYLDDDQDDDGIEMSDVDAMTDDFEPEAEVDEEHIAAEEEQETEPEMEAAEEGLGILEAAEEELPF